MKELEASNQIIASSKNRVFHNFQDRIFFVLYELSKIVGQACDEIMFRSVVAVGPVFGRAILSLFWVFAFALRNEQGPAVLLRPFKFLVGLVFFIPLFIFGIASIFVGGAVATFIGLRNLAEYSLSEEITAWSPLILFFLSAPFWFSPYWLEKTNIIFCLALLLLGFDLLYGQCGILTLGHAAFAYTGSFLTAFLYLGTLGVHVPFILAVTISSISVAAIGALMGLVSLRVKDRYLLVISLSFALSVPMILKSPYLREISGMANGGLPIEAPVFLSFLENVDSKYRNYYFLLLCAATFTVIAHNLLRRSQFGRALRILKCDNEVSKILGISPLRYKVMAFSLSAFYAAFAGGIGLLITNFCSIDMYPVMDSMDYYVGIVIGGPCTILGALVGGAFVSFDPDFTYFLGSIVPKGQYLARGFYGGLLILSVYFMPRGLAHIVSTFFRVTLTRKPTRGSHYRFPPPDHRFSENRISPIREGDR